MCLGVQRLKAPTTFTSPFSFCQHLIFTNHLIRALSFLSVIHHLVSGQIPADSLGPVPPFITQTFSTVYSPGGERRCLSHLPVLWALSIMHGALVSVCMMFDCAESARWVFTRDMVRQSPPTATRFSLQVPRFTSSQLKDLLMILSGGEPINIWGGVLQTLHSIWVLSRSAPASVELCPEPPSTLGRLQANVSPME